MDKRSVLAVGLLSVFLLGAGSASVLSSFGSVSGTVDVRPALNVTDVGNSSSSEEAYFKMENQGSEGISVDRLKVSDSSDSWDSLTGNVSSIPPGNVTVVTSSEVGTSAVEKWFNSSVVHLKVESPEIGNNLAESDTVRVKIDDTVVETYDYGG